MLDYTYPENTGISSVHLNEFLDEIYNRNMQITSMVLLRNGKCIFRFCKKPYDINSIQLWFSVTKAFTGIGVGIACDSGFINLNDNIIKFFPDKLPENISDNLRGLKIKHLLSMSCGIHDNTYAQLYNQFDWLKAFLAQDFPHEGGTYYRYSTHASYMLSAVIERVTGASFYVFLKENLFDLLEINDFTWEYCKNGITAGGMGLSLTVESAAKFAQMLLDEGIYKGRRIVSGEYIKAATSEQANNRLNDTGSHKNGYGYHMSIDHDGSFFHTGAFGQLIYVSKRKNIVFSVTSKGVKTDDIIDLIHEKIINKCSCSNLPEFPEYYNIFRKKINELNYNHPVLNGFSGNINLITDNKYLLDKNSQNLVKICFYGGEKDLFNITFVYKNRKDGIIKFCFSSPVKGESIFIKDIQYHMQKYVSYAVWENKNSLIITVYYIETPYEAEYKFNFYDNYKKFDFSFKMNLSLSLQNFESKGYNYKIKEIKKEFNDPEILNIFSLCMYMPTKEKLEKRAFEYLTDEDVFIYGFFIDEKITGIIVIKKITNENFKINGISVKTEYRNKYIGNLLIDYAADVLNIETLYAETDDDAVDFYRKCNFTIENLGYKYTNTIRYKCQKHFKI